ncbi:MAG: acetylglutamate kinase [Pseudomonadota bacterium]
MKQSIQETPENWLQTAKTLSEALPYMRKFAGETFVIKYGGHAMGEEALSLKFARDIILMKQVGINPIVVHGGGPQIGKMLERLKIQSSFVDGLRVTDAATVEVVEMVLSGSINKQLVTAINTSGGRAIGLSGKDAGLIQAKRVTRKIKDPDSNIESVLDLGFVGEPSHIDPTILDTLYESDIIPVIAPIGLGENGETYNINADTVAGAIAAAIPACKLIILTDVVGVLDDNRLLISELSPKEARKLIKNGTISGGMIPKIETCVHAVENGCGAAHILDGRTPHVLLIETFTEHGAGTMIVA